MKQTFIASDCEKDTRLDIFVQAKMPTYSRSAVKKLNTDGYIKLNGKSVKAGTIVCDGDEIEVELLAPKQVSTEPENIDIDLVYEDSDIAVINKPQGMVVHPAVGNYDKTLVNALLFHIKDLSGINGELRPGIVHRLDKDTSGLLVVAKNDFAHKALAKQLENKTCHREYLGLVVGNIRDENGHIETLIGRHKTQRKKMAVVEENGKIAITDYEVVERFNKYTLVRFILKTGRTHQIRVHSKYLGHPIVGDKTYGVEDKAFKLEGQLLHAYKLEFVHPRTNELVSFCCPVPSYFETALKKLRKKYNNC